MKTTTQLSKTLNLSIAKPLTVILVALLTGCTAANQDQQTRHEVKLEKQQQDQQIQEQAEKRQRIASLAAVEAEMIQFSAARLTRPAPPQSPTWDNYENYQLPDDGGVFQTHLNPLSTFSIDVDTGSYTNTRRMLNQGVIPPQDAIRVEEFINYFQYQPLNSTNNQHPFVVDTKVSAHPWDASKTLMQVRLQGNTPQTFAPVGRNLVFLLDVSGSMNQANKLPLVKQAMKLLARQLNHADRISIVVYAGASGIVLEPTAGDNYLAIEAALNKLSSGGSTNGSEGIQLAYQLAQQQFIKEGVNRIILATDGDFNLGITDHKQLIDLVSSERKKGIALTTLGVGTGNYNEHLIEQLADHGDGNYAYIDSLKEAQKVLMHDLQANIQTIAKDVKIQVEFNPAVVSEYRLIGYRNRRLNDEDFNNDKVDAGEIGAGHRVTALYELTLVGAGNGYHSDLRYGQSSNSTATDKSDELAQVSLRYKLPAQQDSQLVSHLVKRSDIRAFDSLGTDFQFATAVAEFAQHLEGSKYTHTASLQPVLELAQNNRGSDPFGYRAELVSLIRLYMALQPEDGQHTISSSKHNQPQATSSLGIR